MKRKLKNVRAIAARVLDDIILKGQSLDNALSHIDDYCVPATSPRDRGMVQELAYGCMRWLIYLEAITDRLLQRPLKKKDQDVRLLIIIGLYQLLYLSTKPHAAVAETVAAAQELGKPWARSVINACLRNFLRGQQSIVDEVAAIDADCHLSHPPWLLAEMRRSYPEQWLQLAAENNRRPPMHLRINRMKADRDAVLSELANSDIAAKPLPTPCGITLEQPTPVNDLPGFADGNISVQDLSAQYAALLLDPQSGDTILDACAAPGGKACHLLEQSQGDINLVAVEIDSTRGKRIEENLSRLKVRAKISIADVIDTQSWWDGAQFDRILLDAPCSATGVIRRHPDIKFHRRLTDIDNLRAIQRDMLDALWPLLKQGGKLLYATCSILARENEDQIKQLLERKADASEVLISLNNSVARDHGVQLLPGEGDGFYYCLLQKN